MKGEEEIDEGGGFGGDGSLQNRRGRASRGLLGQGEGAWQGPRVRGSSSLGPLVNPAGSSPPRSTLVPDPQPLTEEAQALFEVAAGGAGGRVSGERVHHTAAPEGTLRPLES